MLLQSASFITRVLAGVIWLGSISSFASNLTVCGSADGATGDSDGLANGSVTATCSFPQGFFTGTVTETISDLTYLIAISGSLYGSADNQLLATGQFSLVGEGSVYSYVLANGILESTNPGAASTGREFLTVLASASNHNPSGAYGSPPVLIRAGKPLPIGIEFSIGTLDEGEFSGLGSLNLYLSYDTGGLDRRFSFPSSNLYAQASTDPNRVIPEPSTVLSAAFGIFGLLVIRKMRNR